MKNNIPTFGQDEPLEPESPYVKKVDYDAKVLEIENSLKEKITKEDFPDHSIYALKEEIPKDYLKKEDLPDPIDTSNFVTKEEAQKFAIKSELYTRQEVKDRYIKKEAHKRDLDTKMDKVELPDWEKFATKSDIEGLIDKECVDLRNYVQKQELNHYVKKDELPVMEHCYCLVKLESDFRFYDGIDWEFESYMGQRGPWKTEKLHNGKLEKPGEFIFWTPFEGVFHVDFACTVRRDTHLCKPHVIQRIRTSGPERTLFDYFDNKSVAIGSRDDVTVKTFNKTADLWLPKGAWIRFSIQFTNRAYNKRKQWIHCVGATGSYSPTYFCVRGTKV